ncbi:MAG TPA: O-antigen ligase family protein [Blastocatellia bacterium]|nr:O-antigen ligase family protein [Blastocatellia bacterium]
MERERDGETERRRDGETGRRGDGETGRKRRREKKRRRGFFVSPSLFLSVPLSLSSIIALGLMAVMAGCALAFGAVEPWSLAALGLAIIALMILWCAKGVVDRRLEISAPSTALPLFALALLGALQGITIMDSAGKRSSVSLDAEATRLTTEVLLILLIAFLLSANFLAKAPALTWLRNFLIFFGMVLSIFGLIQRFTWNGRYYWVIEPSVEPSNPFGPFVNHNHFAGYVEMLAPIPVALILRRAVRGPLALIYGFAAAMMGLAVVLSLSRGGMVSLVAGLMFVVAFGFRRSRERRIEDRGSRVEDRRQPIFNPRSSIPLAASRIGAMIVMLFTIGAGVWWIGADPVIRRIENSGLAPGGMGANARGETFFQSRGWIWRDTTAMIRNKWALGVGLGAYQTAYPIYSSHDGTLLVGQAHNDYLQIMADAGIFGAVIALWFIFLVARDSVRASRHKSRVMSGTALGAAGGMFALFVHSLFDFNFQIPSNALLFLVLASVVSQIASAATGESGQPQSAQRAQ